MADSTDKHWEYSTDGKGEPLILLHGLFGTHRTLGGLAKQLKQDYRIISPSLRNHGGSPWKDEMDYHGQTRDLLQIMDREHVRRACLLGHSMGGKVAMTLAMEHPNRCRALVVLDNAPVSYDSHSLRSYCEHLLQLPLKEIKTRQQADELLQEKIPESQVRTYLLTNLVTRDNQARWRCNLEAIYRSLDRISGFPTPQIQHNAYPGPTLFLYSPDSGYLRPGHLPEIHRYFPQAICTAVENTGHWLHVDQPREVTRQIQDFLKTHS